jgi:uncharacterized protein YbaA (DUF1428 family)
MKYVDGYLTPVKPEMKDAYIALSKKTAAVYKEFGCLRVVDCWQDEEPKDAAAFHAEEARDEVTSAPSRTFKQALGTQGDELVVLSWMEWPDKQTRDAGLAKALADPRVQPVEGEPLVFEGRRLIASGFNVIVDL